MGAVGTVRTVRPVGTVGPVLGEHRFPGTFIQLENELFFPITILAVAHHHHGSRWPRWVPRCLHRTEESPSHHRPSQHYPTRGLSFPSKADELEQTIL